MDPQHLNLLLTAAAVAAGGVVSFGAWKLLAAVGPAFAAFRVRLADLDWDEIPMWALAAPCLGLALSGLVVSQTNLPYDVRAARTNAVTRDPAEGLRDSSLSTRDREVMVQARLEAYRQRPANQIEVTPDDALTVPLYRGGWAVFGLCLPMGVAFTLVGIYRIS